MIDLLSLLYAYLLIGFIKMIWCFAWAYPEAKAPLSAYLLIILIWPYQVHLRINKRNK